MSIDVADTSSAPGPSNGPSPDRRRQSSGRTLRRIWRTHFYAAVIAAPMLVVFAITGLVILYTQPIQDQTARGLQIVSAQGSSVPLDDQVAAARERYPDLPVSQVVPPRDATHSTLVEFAESDEVYRQVYVNPYTGVVLGTMKTGNDIVGLANRVHGNLNNESVQVSVPNVGHLIDSENPTMLRMPVSDVVIEVATIWALVLALTGLYLWWPRHSQRKPLLRVRWSKGGRLRWRDLHSASGILLSVLLLIFIVSGMAWSNYWGAAWYSFADKATPNAEFEEPLSTPVTAGSLNRVGNRIPWAVQGDLLPGSGVPTDGSAPRPIGWTAIAAIAEQEGMQAGYSIVPPVDDITGETPVYGTVQLNNPWPNRQQHSRSVYLDQFTGRTLAESTEEDWGAVQRVTDYTVSLHMGTQLGLFTRILTTVGCLAILVSLASSIVLWWKRRPTGSAGFPARSGRRDGQVFLAVVAVVLAVLYPLWGVSLLAILAIDVLVDVVARRRRSAREPGEKVPS